MQDLSNILPVDPVSALAPTSQAGGNMLSSNEEAMTAPRSQPVDVLTDRDVQSDPKITPSNKAEIAPGTDGKPKATQAGKPQGARWTPTTTPTVVARAER